MIFIKNFHYFGHFQTRRKSSWVAVVKNEQPFKNDVSEPQSPSEHIKDERVFESVSPKDHNSNDESDDNGNEQTIHETNSNEDITNENDINDFISPEKESIEKSGSITSSLARCPFAVSSEISAASPAPSRSSEDAASTRRALSKSQLRGNRGIYNLKPYFICLPTFL